MTPVSKQADPSSFEAADDTSKMVKVAEDIVSTVQVCVSWLPLTRECKVKSLMLLQAVVERYGSQKDSLSVVLLCEATVREFAALLPKAHPELTRLQRLAGEGALALTPMEMRVVSQPL